MVLLEARSGAGRWFASLVAEVVVVLFLHRRLGGLRFAQATWLAFAAMVVYSLLCYRSALSSWAGGAGKLLDVRQIRALWLPRIVAGFVVGFIVAEPPPRRCNGYSTAEQLLLTPAAVAAGVMR